MIIADDNDERVIESALSHYARAQHTIKSLKHKLKLMKMTQE